MTAVRKADGDPSVDIEHYILPHLKEGAPMPDKTVCGISTEGMVPIDWKMEPWLHGCFPCAMGVKS